MYDLVINQLGNIIVDTIDSVNDTKWHLSVSMQYSIEFANLWAQEEYTVKSSY